MHLIIFKKEHQELLKNTLPTLFFSPGLGRIPVLRHRYFIKGEDFREHHRKQGYFPITVGKKKKKGKVLSVLFFLSITPIRGGKKKNTTKNKQAKISLAVMRNEGCQSDI